MSGDSNRGSRPTSKVGTQEDKLIDREGGTPHFWWWANVGSVAAQFRLRIWRFDFQFTFWRSYGE